MATPTTATVSTAAADIATAPTGQKIGTLRVYADTNTTVYLAVGANAEVGKGIKLDLFNPKEILFDVTSRVSAIVESGTATLTIHEG